MYTVSEIMKDSWSSDYLLLRRYIVRAKGQRGEDVPIYNHFPPTTNLRSLGGTMREKHILDPNIITDCIPFQDYTLRHTPTITAQGWNNNKATKKTRRHQSSKSSQYTTVWIS